MPSKNSQKLIFLAAGIVIALAFFSFYLELLSYKKIAQGVMVAGENISGLNYDAVKNKVNELANETKQQNLQILYGDKKWSVLPENIGISFDVDQTAQEIISVGHKKNIFSSLAQQAASFFNGRNIGLVYWFDEQKFNNFIQENLASLERPAKNATLKYRPVTDDFILVAAQDGQIFDIVDFKNQIEHEIASSNQKPILLSQITQKPILISDNNDAAGTQAKQILDEAPYLLQNGSSTWPIEKQILADWLEFEPAQDAPQTMTVAISPDAVKDFLAQLAPSINQEPVNATLTFKDGKVQAFALSQKGTDLNIEDSASQISQDILVGEKVIDLQVNEKEPQITTETIDTLGITDLLGVGTSTYAGSPKNRIYNISIGAGKINGLVVDPNQEFSIVQALGTIDETTGYLPELVIKNNKTIPEYGGGLCQISTTLFRAAMNAGLKITERYPHAFPVHYYNPQGFDATIYPPHPDLRFLNDTPNHILIQSKIKGSVITFEIYGTADGRQAKIIGPTILASNPDGSMKTVLYQEIWRDGVMERKDTFRSNYRSPALYPVERNPLE